MAATSTPKRRSREDHVAEWTARKDELLGRHRGVIADALDRGLRREGDIDAALTAIEADLAECEDQLCDWTISQIPTAKVVARRERAEVRIVDGGCGVCGGTGHRPEFAGIADGVCFHCVGTGVAK